MLIALTRDVSTSFDRCELTHLARQPIDVERARQQHLQYENVLAHAGCRVERLASDASMPDSVFIEDSAVVFDEIAIVTRPGAVSRRIETPAVAGTLRMYRDVQSIVEPGTMDGGDVLVVGHRVFVGRSSRTNGEGIRQMRGFLTPFGYVVEEIEVTGCLHLKSAVTALGDHLLLVNPAWLPMLPAESFRDFERLDVDPSEQMAANALRVAETIVYPESFPRTLERLERRGLQVRAVDASELQKAEGAVTCCSLIFREAL